MDGYAHLGPTLSEDEVAALRDAMERKWADPAIRADEAGDHIRRNSMMRMFEYDRSFRDLIEREPFPTIAEAILGEDCHLMSQNSLYNEPGVGGGWHLDDLCQYPLPEGSDGHSIDSPPPCMVLQIFTPLTDLDTEAKSPTQVVPGSHLAGHKPPTGEENPTFRNRGPVSIFAKAGDAYLFNNQTWHRGGPNTTDHPRLLTGATYSRRFIAQRFYPFIDYRVPDHVWEGASERLQRLLGRHSKGAYG
jgi:ectoine hydroxylase-related dioxygenase (phytanoyl-CoA dioxygenase family)